MVDLLPFLRLYLDAPSGPLPPTLLGYVRHASEEGVAGLVGHVLARDASLAALPGARDLIEEHVREFARNAHFLSRLGAVGAALEARGLEALVLKGGALIPTAYGGIPGLRPLSDLDLLVRPEQRAQVEDVLRALPPTPPIVPFDLHGDLVNSERIGARTLAFRFPAGELWRTSRPLPGQPAALRCLAPEFEALNLAAHALKHSYSRLAWLVDLALVLPPLDPEDLHALARRTGTTRALAYACHLLERMFAVRVRGPAVCLNGLERRYLDGVPARRHSHLLGSVVMAFSVPGLGPRLAYLWEIVFPARRVLREMFPGTPDWLLYPRRLARLVEQFRSDRRRREDPR